MHGFCEHMMCSHQGLNLKVDKMKYSLGSLDPNWAIFSKCGQDFSRSGHKKIHTTASCRTSLDWKLKRPNHPVLMIDKESLWRSCCAYLIWTVEKFTNHHWLWDWVFLEHAVILCSMELNYGPRQAQAQHSQQLCALTLWTACPSCLACPVGYRGGEGQKAGSG